MREILPVPILFSETREQREKRLQEIDEIYRQIDENNARRTASVPLFQLITPHDERDERS